MQKSVDRVSDTCYCVGMPNKRASNVKRISITLDEEFLHMLEAQSKASGMDRLEFIRRAIAAKLDKDDKSGESQTKKSK